jgi:hypothetical protein
MANRRTKKDMANLLSSPELDKYEEVSLTAL